MEMMNQIPMGASTRMQTHRQLRFVDSERTHPDECNSEKTPMQNEQQEETSTNHASTDSGGKVNFVFCYFF
jgi:hypothetical protein